MPPRFIGRMMSWVTLGSYGMVPFGALAMGWVIDASSVRVALGVARRRVSWPVRYWLGCGHGLNRRQAVPLQAGGVPFASRSRAFKRLAASREGTCRGRLVSWRRVTASASASVIPEVPTRQLPCRVVKHRDDGIAEVLTYGLRQTAFVVAKLLGTGLDEIPAGFRELDQADPA